MRAILSYLALVGIPLIALVGILQVGRDLRPPRAAHGLYAVTFDSSGSGRCVYDLQQNGRQYLAVTQSGPRVELQWGGLGMRGIVAGDSLRAVAELREGTPSSRASCLTADTLVLVAAIGRSASDARLAGEFRMPGCRSCKVVQFRALRLMTREGA